MRRPFVMLVAAAVALLPLGAQPAQAAPAQAAAAQAPQKTTFTGDVVLWAFQVPADKAADYEKVVEKLKAALNKIERPEAKQQLAGWKVIKNAQPQQDGSLLYIHIISPVVKDADYSIGTLVYEAFPDPAERNAFYELYKGALKGQFFAIQGPVVSDFSK